MLTPFKKVTPAFSIESLAHPHEHIFPSSFASVGEFYDFIEICYLKSGKAELVIEEKVYLIEEGSFLIYAPLHLHKFRSIGEMPLKLYNLSMQINGDMPNEIFNTPISLEPRLEEKFLSAFANARDFLEGGADDTVGTVAALELQSLIVELCREPSGRHEVLSTPAALTYKAIIETMEREVRSNITLEDIAKKANISKSYLKTLFEKYCDLSPKEYYRKLRLQESMQLLLDGYSVSKIAELMNFSYPNHFTQFFKKETGLSPTEYKTYTADYKERL